MIFFVIEAEINQQTLKQKSSNDSMTNMSYKLRWRKHIIPFSLITYVGSMTHALGEKSVRELGVTAVSGVFQKISELSINSTHQACWYGFTI